MGAPLLRPCGPPKKFGRFLDFNGRKLPSQSSKSQDLGQIWTQKIQKKSLPPNIFFSNFILIIFSLIKRYGRKKKVENNFGLAGNFFFWALLFLHIECHDQARNQAICSTTH